MTSAQMAQAFKFGMDKMDGLNYPNFLPEEIDLLLNQGQSAFVKERYGNTNTKRTSFEETQKRSEDLKELIRDVVIIPTPNSGVVGIGENITTNSVFCTLPADHWLAIWERVVIQSDKCNTDIIPVFVPASIDGNGNAHPATTAMITGKYAQVRPIEHIQVDKILYDVFKGADYTKVLRLMYENQVELIPAIQSTIFRYILRYIKRPVQIVSFGGSPVDCELSEHTHQEIVNNAIAIALEGIEAKRINTFTPLIENREE